MKNPMFALLLLATASLFACSDNEESPRPDAPQIRLTTHPDALPASGGDGSFTFTVDNPAEGIAPAVSTQNTWLRDPTCTPTGTVSFTAEANDDEASRTGTITISYQGAEEVRVDVTQLGAEGLRFSVTYRDVTSTGATFVISPSDQNVYYTWLVLEKDLFASHYGSDTGRLLEEQTAALLADLEELRKQDPYASLVDMLDRNDLTRRDNTFTPATEYLVFVYGVNETSGAPMLPPTQTPFSTKAFEVADPCTFEVLFSNVRQTDMDLTIRPSDDATGYYYGLCETAELRASSPEALALQMIRQAEIAGIDWSLHDTLDKGELTVNTADDLEIYDLEPGVEYSVLVFGVSALGERPTVVAHAERRMAEVPPCAMAFEITLLEQYTTGAKLRITPSVDNETYIAGCVQTVNYQAFATDEEFMERILSDGNYILLEGEEVLDRSQSLLTGKDYICFAFGYIGGITTPLTFDFQTGTVVTDGTARVEIERIEILDGTAAGYAGRALVYAHFTCSDNTVHWYCRWAKSTDGVLDYDVTDQDLVNWLAKGEEESTNYVDRLDPGTVLDWGGETFICAVAVDEQGKIGPLMKYRIVADRSAMKE